MKKTTFDKEIIISNEEEAFRLANLIGELGFKYPVVSFASNGKYRVTFLSTKGE